MVGDEANGRSFLFFGRCRLNGWGSDRRGSDSFSGRSGSLGSRGDCWRSGIVADGSSSGTGHCWSRGLFGGRLRLGSEPRQGALAGGSRGPGVCGGVGSGWDVACAGNGRSGTPSEGGRTSRRERGRLSGG